jgi:hypothetical protein
MFCGNCGTKLPEGAKFCGSCGTSTEPAQHVNPEPQVNTAPNQSQQQAAPPPLSAGVCATATTTASYDVLCAIKYRAS